MHKSDEPGHGVTSTKDANPPSYDYATGSTYILPVYSLEFSLTLAFLAQSSMNAAPQSKSGPSAAHAIPSSAPPQMPAGSNLYHYQHPVNGHLISSPLPPNHPEMICLQEGQHITSSRYGLLGILAAVFWFPLGIGLCLLDRRVVCKRCGRVIDDGFSC